MYNNIFKKCKIYTVLSKNDPHQSVYNYINLPVCYSNLYKFTLTLFILFLIVYYFFMYFDDKKRNWIIVIVCKERETVLKNQENLIS